MKPEEKKAMGSLKKELNDYPEMMMVTISRKDLETVINYLKKSTKKALK